MEPGWHLVRCSARMTMIGAAIGTTMVMGMEGPSTTTTMFMCLIRRSHHAATATILQTGRLQTVRAESAARAESAGLAESAARAESAGLAGSAARAESAGLAGSAALAEPAGPAESAAQEAWVNRAELAGPGEWVSREELAGQAVSRVQVDLGVLDLSGRQDHLLVHTIRLQPGRTRAPSRT